MAQPALRVGVIVISCLVVAATGALAGSHNPVVVTAEPGRVQTVDDHQTNVTFTVTNNHSHQRVTNLTVHVEAIPEPLQVQTDSPIEIEPLEPTESTQVTVTVYVPDSTPQGNYSIEAAAYQGNYSLDNATGMVNVNYDDGPPESDGSSASGDNTHENTTGGSAIGPMPSDDNSLLDPIFPDEWSWDSIFPWNWSLDWPDWVPLAD